VGVNLQFYVARQNCGDLDNLGKSVIDGMNGIAFDDDSQIVALAMNLHRCQKSEERVEVRVTSIPKEAVF